MQWKSSQQASRLAGHFDARWDLLLATESTHDSLASAAMALKITSVGEKMSKIASKKHQTFFLLLKIAYQKKQKFFLYPQNNASFVTILKKLQAKALILGYFKKNASEIQIFLRYDLQSLPAIHDIFLFPKCRSASKKTLKAIRNDYPFSFFLLHTRFGILDLNECQEKNCGGELLVNIK